MKRLTLALAVTGMLVATSAWAGSLTVPNTFQGGQKALASEVNANFDEVEAEVTDNADNISSNATSITRNTAGISSNADSITDIKGQLSNIDALTLEGRPASDFADSNHPHAITMSIPLHWQLMMWSPAQSQMMISRQP